MSDAIETFNLNGLHKLLKALKSDRQPVARVGIIGSKVGRGNGPTNADIGAAHEFGTANMPQRSFLRVPINKHLNHEIERSGLLDEHTLKEVIKQGTVRPWLEKVAICAEAVVADAFESEGDGEWLPWIHPNYENNTGQLLDDTGQLKRSITSEVKG